MAEAKDPKEPFLSTNVERKPGHDTGAEALRDPPTALRIVIVLFGIALVAMVVAIAVLKSPGT